MIRYLKMAGCAAALLSIAACATTPAAPPGPPPPPPPTAPTPPPAPPKASPVAAGADVFMNVCSGCHNGAGRAPSKDTLSMMDPNYIVTALTTGAMMRQGSGLSVDQRKAVAQFLTGKAPS